MGAKSPYGPRRPMRGLDYIAVTLFSLMMTVILAKVALPHLYGDAFAQLQMVLDQLSAASTT